jgi:ATP-binding cassette subfamily B protein
VAVLQDGRVTAVGTHHDLLATDPHYRYIISSLEEDYEANDPHCPAPGSTDQQGADQQTADQQTADQQSQEALS